MPNDQELMRKHNEKMDELQATWDVMGEEMVRNIKKLGRSGKRSRQSTRRDVARSLFACIEGISYVYRRIALEKYRHRAFVGEITVAELYKLREQRHDISGKTGGIGKPGTHHLKTLPGILFSIRMLAKSCVGPGHEIKTSGNDWDCFKQFLDLRDRITHPKLRGDLAIGEKDLGVIVHGLAWFLAESGRVGKLVISRQAQLTKPRDYSPLL